MHYPHMLHSLLLTASMSYKIVRISVHPSLLGFFFPCYKCTMNIQKQPADIATGHPFFLYEKFFHLFFDGLFLEICRTLYLIFSYVWLLLATAI